MATGEELNELGDKAFKLEHDIQDTLTWIFGDYPYDISNGKFKLAYDNIDISLKDLSDIMIEIRPLVYRLKQIKSKLKKLEGK